MVQAVSVQSPPQLGKQSTQVGVPRSAAVVPRAMQQSPPALQANSADSSGSSSTVMPPLVPEAASLMDKAFDGDARCAAARKATTSNDLEPRAMVIVSGWKEEERSRYCQDVE